MVVVVVVRMQALELVAGAARPTPSLEARAFVLALAQHSIAPKPLGPASAGVTVRAHDMLA